MSPTIRRLYSLLAVLVFLLLAVSIVAWASGYHWLGWKAGLARSGALYISSEPKATVSINGVVHGVTPQRLSRLTPGVYTVSVSKSGYGTWSSLIKIEPGLGKVVGPIALYPESMATTTLSIPKDATVLRSSDYRRIFTRQPTANGWSVTPIWPTTGPITTVSWQPERIFLSPDGQTTLIASGQQTAYIGRDGVASWELGSLSEIQWDNAVNTIWYARNTDNVLTRFDALTKTATALHPATSFSVVGDTLWFTTESDGTTTVWKQLTFGQESATAMMTKTGHWSLIAHSLAPFISEGLNGDVLRLSSDRLTNAISEQSYGRLTSLFWTSANQAPLWLSGNELWTIDGSGLPQLIDRYATTLSFVGWQIPHHVVILADTKGVRLISIGAQQGRGTILDWASPQQVVLFGIDSAKKIAIVQGGTPTELLQLQW